MKIRMTEAVVVTGNQPCKIGDELVVTTSIGKELIDSKLAVYVDDTPLTESKAPPALTQPATVIVKRDTDKKVDAEAKAKAEAEAKAEAKAQAEAEAKAQADNK